jgi:cyclophilin family peptidyl-prolyl cis-trans isomerase/HEAT repeat protein
MTRLIFLFGLIITCVSCSKSEKNKFDDKIQIKIADLQDRRSTDSLIAYLYSDNDEYRSAAALALASVQDTTALDTLGKLSTSDPHIRRNAAFALGQMNNLRATTPLIYGELGDEPGIQHEIYEALGKAIRKEDLSLFPSQPEDTAILAGVAWGIYRAGLRGIFDSVTTNFQASILSNGKSGYNAKLAAAHYFARTAFTPQPGVAQALTTAASASSAVGIRMAVVNACSKLKPEESLPVLRRVIKDQSYRVRVNAARALRTQPWDVSKQYYEQLLNDEDVNVSVAAAEAVVNIAKDEATLRDWARNAKNWRVQATLYEAVMKLSPLYSEEIKEIYSKSSNPYQQAGLLTALSHGNNSKFIFDQFRKTDVKVIKSTGANAIVRSYTSKSDQKWYADVYKQIILDGDLGAIISVCEALGDSTLGFKKVIADFSFLEEAKSKLSLPKDYETYLPLERTLNYFKGLPPPPPLVNQYNHPIDWKLASTINKDQKVVIHTTKGSIVMRLFIDEAPGSVVNFVKLINDQYYHGKTFHRVVPNFVVQTGCDRGDGFGSLDYSIRSEFSTRKYNTGSVGMASAGKDTEGTQWFITHSPTPHLDGKYTIFAEVINGMDVVHKLEVGDQITSAYLTD